MEDFQLQLKCPPQGFYVPGMTVTGTVLTVTDKPKDYEAIEVKILGFAHVQWSESVGDLATNYTSNEDFLSAFVCVWDKDTSARGGQFPAGSFEFPFSFHLVGNKSPSSYESTVGCITYVVEARVRKGIRRGDTFRKVTIKVVDLVNFNHPNLLQPKSMEVRKTLWGLCCASGPIIIRVSTPRTGYCIQRDSVPVTVSFENGSNRKVRKFVVSIRKVVKYTAEGSHLYERHNVVRIHGGQVLAHRTMEWQPPPLSLYSIPVTTINCDIIKVNYFLRVKAVIRCADHPTIEIPLALGILPIPGAEVVPQQELAPHPHQGFIPPTQPQSRGIPYAMPVPPMPQPYSPPVPTPRHHYFLPPPRFNFRNQLPVL